MTKNPHAAAHPGAPPFRQHEILTYLAEADADGDPLTLGELAGARSRASTWQIVTAIAARGLIEVWTATGTGRQSGRQKMARITEYGKRSLRSANGLRIPLAEPEKE